MLKPLFFLTLLASLATAPAFAATVSANLTVRATVVSSCNLNTNATADAGNAVIDFGNVTSTLTATAVEAGTDTSGGAALSIICTTGTPYSVSAGLGNNANGSQRRMIGGTAYLPYALFSDQNRSSPIINGTPFFNGTGNGVSQPIPIYGRIPANTTLPPAGAYQDVVVLTVEY